MLVGMGFSRRPQSRRNIDHADPDGQGARARAAKGVRGVKGVAAPVAAVVAVLAWAGAAGAHVGPSPDVNNRYAKLTLLGGAVRVAYTVLFGERPGAAERRRSDSDGDGLIDDREKNAIGARLLAEIGPQLAVEVDGQPTPARWRVADVGLGMRQVQAGTFAVDLVLVAPLRDARLPEHRVRFEDRWQAPVPGEEEIRIEESPGVHLLASQLVGSEAAGRQTSFPFTGNPAGDRAVEARFTADPGLRVPLAPAGTRDVGRTPVALTVLLIAIIAVAAPLAVRARRRWIARGG
jgi:hypothetical protein